MNRHLLFLLPALAPVTAFGADGSRPNIVIILADDLGWGDISCHGSVIQTPNIDRFFNEGVELTRHYAAPVSSPTRAGLLTGYYPSRFGIRETVIPPWRDYGLDENVETIADVLGRNGYRNRAIIGKWHLGHGRLAYYPLNRGFTHFYGHLNGAIDYFTHEREGELDWHDDWESSYDKGYSTDLITDEAVECINEYKDSGPFLLYVAYNAPHGPYQAPEDEIEQLIPAEDFKKLKKKDRNGWTYRAMVSRMDKGVGKITEALEKNRLMENTVILFMSDNGGVPGLEPYSTNRPFRGSKFTEFEGGVKVSAAFYSGSGVLGESRKINDATSFVDILPTVKELAGIEESPVHPYDGTSILPLLSGKVKALDRYIYLGVGAAVSGKHKMILKGRNPKLKLEEDLFVDIRKDPYERQSDNGNRKEKEKMKKFILEYDAIKPSMEEKAYGVGKEGFVAPKEWKINRD